jgi:hypothetical protein
MGRFRFSCSENRATFHRDLVLDRFLQESTTGQIFTENWEPGSFLQRFLHIQRNSGASIDSMLTFHSSDG